MSATTPPFGHESNMKNTVSQSEPEGTNCDALNDSFEALSAELKLELENEQLIWLIARGHWLNQDQPFVFNKLNFDLDDYANYDNLTLITLANQNDAKASMTLVYRLTYKEPCGDIETLKSNQDLIIKYGTKAAMLGYSAAILPVLSQYVNKHSLMASKESGDRKNAVMAHTWYRFAIKRNDFHIMLLGPITLASAPITPEEEILSEQQAEALYIELEQERFRAGHTYFDNSYPDFIAPMIDCIKNSPNAKPL